MGSNVLPFLMTHFSPCTLQNFRQNGLLSLKTTLGISEGFSGPQFMGTQLPPFVYKAYARSPESMSWGIRAGAIWLVWALRKTFICFCSSQA